MLFSAVNNHVWSAVECVLTPSPSKRGEHQIGALNLLYAGLITPIALFTGYSAALEAVVVKVCTVAYRYFYPLPLKNNFEDVTADPRHWSRYGDIAKNLEEEPLGQGNSAFQYGVATCTYQDSGSFHCPDSQWVEWETKVIENPADRSGKSANVFEHYKTEHGREEIIKRLIKLGVTSYRFSVEWSHLQSEKEGLINAENLQVYIDLCKKLRDRGITPLVTLHHFSEPTWFHQMGSFELFDNTPHFVNFGEAIVDALSVEYNGKPLVDEFCTINEPNIEAFSRYVFGSFSASPPPQANGATSWVGKVFEIFSRYVLKKLTPGTILDFNRAGNFLHGALHAHSQLYNKVKEKHPNAKVGIVHQYLRFTPTIGLFYPITKYLTQLINDVTLRYFQTGVFRLKMPFCHIESKDTKPTTDFAALQYYVRPKVISFGEEKTLMPFPEDPEGLYQAILDVHSHFQTDVWITENGISTHSDEQRRRYTTRALFAAKEAAKVIGPEKLLRYFYWCTFRNLEWNMGMNSQHFGAYDLLSNGEIAEEPKEGMDTFIKTAQAFNTWKATTLKSG